MDIKRNTQICETLKSIAAAENLTPEQAEALKKAENYLRYYAEDDWNGRTNSSQLLAHITEDVINSSNYRKEDFIKRMTTKCHRYLQGQFFQTIMCMIKTYATYPDHMFDGRNQFIQDVCKRIVENDPEDFGYCRSVQDIEERKY